MAVLGASLAGTEAVSPRRRGARHAVARARAVRAAGEADGIGVVAPW